MLVRGYIPEKAQNAHIAQPESGRVINGPVIAAAEAVKHWATALNLISDHEVIDVEQGDAIYSISRVIEFHAEAVLAALDTAGFSEQIADKLEWLNEVAAGEGLDWNASVINPSGCVKRIAEELERLYAIAAHEEIDWGPSVAMTIIGRAIERETIILGPLCS